MTAKCAYCGSALKFDADIQMLVCEHCSGMFPVEKTEEEKMLSESEQNISEDADSQDSTNADFWDDADEMECNVYKCTSCGAQLVLNDVEAATYCAYCGQPTIVFDRIVKRRRPKYIIPFSVTKNVALVNIREKFLKGIFVPREVKHFQPDMLRGIYVPYILYDMQCKDRQLIQSTVSDPDSDKSDTRYFYRDAVATFREIPVDASSQLPNEFSERLEPYPRKGMVKFKAEYLSGFYADLKDDNLPYLKQIARQRARDMLNNMIKRSVPGQNQKIISCMPHPDQVFEKEEYALFPVWFMVFHQDKETYTIMVNGQTGKVVCALPIDRRKVAILFSLLALPLSTLGFFFLPMIYTLGENIRMWAYLLVFVGIPALIAAGIHNLHRLKKNQQQTTGRRIKKFVMERQDS